MMPVHKRATAKLAKAGFEHLQVVKGMYGYSVQDRRFRRQAQHRVCDTPEEAVDQVVIYGKVPQELGDGEVVDLCADAPKKMYTPPTPGPWTCIDTPQPKRASDRCHAIMTGGWPEEGQPRKVVATIDFDYTGCRGVRGDFTHFFDHHEGWANGKLIAGAPGLVAALYYLGGGGLFIEEYGRLCFCPVHMVKDCTREHMLGTQHATSCDDAWKAFVAAVGKEWRDVYPAQ